MTTLPLEQGVDWTFDESTPEGKLVGDALKGDIEARRKLPHNRVSTICFCLCTKCEKLKEAIKFKIIQSVR